MKHINCRYKKRWISHKVQVMTDIIKFDGDILPNTTLSTNVHSYFRKEINNKKITWINVFTKMINKLKKLSHEIAMQESQSYIYPQNTVQ